MESTSSPIETLRQLKEMLDAGTITAPEFDKLKQQLIFSSMAPSAAESTATSSPSPATEPEITPPFTASIPEVIPEPEAFGLSDSIEADTMVEVEDMADYAATEPEPTAPVAPNYLNLVLAIGGLLALLGVVLYLNLHPRDSEHIGSTSLTPADTVSTVETGPQAEQLNLPPPAPETIRVAPAHPAAPLPSTIAPRKDSTTAPVAAPDSAI